MLVSFARDRPALRSASSVARSTASGLTVPPSAATSRAWMVAAAFPRAADR
jgi:hypothetical protein